MSDMNSSLPIRSENDVDSAVIVKLTDGTSGTVNQARIDADKNLHVEVHGDSPTGVDKVLRVSELGAPNADGIYSVTDNTKPSTSGLVASVRDAAPSDTTQTQRLTSVTSGTKRLLDVAIHDENGAVFSASNPLPVTLLESEGVEINNFTVSSSVAAGASVNHDYTVTTGTTLQMSQISCTASGLIKAEIRVETAVASSVFATKFVQFNSTANPNINLNLRECISVAAGVKVRIVISNRDKAAQDTYSTLSGHEVT